MADTPQVPINGNYPAYPDSYNPTAHAAVNNTSFQPTQSSTPTNAAASEQKTELPKDEVGWFFVEQYYTTMSRSPEKLHLFYARQSQLVFGTEAESVPVVVGQKAINEKIKQLDFQECKVRVLNVDSQASFANILISVIGEISNKSEPSRKFIQTFVLAEQPNGYYVLNDIFRYLVDEEEELLNEQTTAAPGEEQAAEVPAQPATETAPPAVESQVNNDVAASKVDEKLEQADANGEVEQPKEVASEVNGVGEEPQAAAEAVDPKIEKPPTPDPTPASPAQKPADAAAAAPEKETAAPAKSVPKTWANIASKSGATTPVVPAIPVAPPKPAATPSTSQPAPTPAAPARETTPSQPSSNDGSGWQTAGQDSKKTQPRAGEDQNVLAYIKNVNDKVDANLLKQTLSRFGKLKYFDVSRPKNCAFVEFAEPAGYAAAVAANPHQIGTEQISVEERRTRANAYGANANFGSGRGGAGRGRGDRAGSQGRGGFQRDGGRGGFGMRGRGGNAGPKGRSQAQAA